MFSIRRVVFLRDYHFFYIFEVVYMQMNMCICIIHIIVLHAVYTCLCERMSESHIDIRHLTAQIQQRVSMSTKQRIQKQNSQQRKYGKINNKPRGRKWRIVRFFYYIYGQKSHGVVSGIPYHTSVRENVLSSASWPVCTKKAHIRCVRIQPFSAFPFSNVRFEVYTWLCSITQTLAHVCMRV